MNLDWYSEAMSPELFEQNARERRRVRRPVTWVERASSSGTALIVALILVFVVLAVASELGW